MQSWGKSFKSLKSRLGLPVSPSPERDATGRIIQKRARSPSPPPPLTQEQIAERILQAEEQYLARRQEEIARQQASLRVEASEFIYNRDVNEIINSINGYLNSFFGEEGVNVNVDEEDSCIRFIVGMIVTSNNARISAAQKLRRSRLLLQAVANVIINIAKRTGRELSVWLPIILSGLSKVGRFLVQLGVASGSAVFNVGASFGSRVVDIASRYVNQPPPLVRVRSESPPRRMQQSMQNMASVAYESIATGLPEFYNALSSVLVIVYRKLTYCLNAAASRVASLARSAANAACAYFTTEQAVEQAVVQVIPEEQVDNCPVCMDEATGLNIVYTIPCKHKFHSACINGWLQRKRDCPTCRGPVTDTKPLQGGGGSKKYRSKSKSKSKSRRYLSKPHKSRKARKRVRHFSSRRK